MLSQKLSATTRPSGWLFDVATHVIERFAVLAAKPHAVGHVSGPSFHPYVTHSGVAGHVMVSAGLLLSQ
jgi:hypothetical protein